LVTNSSGHSHERAHNAQVEHSLTTSLRPPGHPGQAIDPRAGRLFGWLILRGRAAGATIGFQSLHIAYRLAR
jgi:hypothetical protein